MVTDRQTYRTARAQGIRAIQAFRQAQERAPGLFGWDDLDLDGGYPAFGTATRELDSGTLAIRLVSDEDVQDLSERTMVEWSERTWRTREYEHESDTGERTRIDCVKRVVDDGRGTTWVGDLTGDFKGLLDYHRAAGESRAVAWDSARAGVEKITTYARELVRGDRSPFGIVATLTDPSGHEAGYAACWGFDHDPWNMQEREALLDELNGLAEEALEAAQTRTLPR